LDDELNLFFKIFIMKKRIIALAAGCFCILACNENKEKTQTSTQESKAGADTLLKLPTGFFATVFAETTGRARHIAVNSNGDVYIKLERVKDDKTIFRLRDTNSDGVADESMGFGNYVGTGIAIKNGYLYASSNEEVFRYKLNSNNEVENPDNPEKIITGLVNQNQHASKSITLDNAGNIYVNIGAPSNACQEKDRTADSKGMDPCPILEKAGGIWQFKTDKLNQSYPEGVRYATGLRNVVGLDWNNDVNALYVTQHGRDMLFQFYPAMFDQKAGAELPSEEMFRIKTGSDCGWPYCYNDHVQNKKLLMPEYGGDGKTTTRCEGKEKPIIAFPGHLAPNALLFYSGKQFPEKYQKGAFIAFHGSWNRAPEPQEGYYVVFVPFNDGLPSGNWEVFADGFAGKDIIKTPADAKYRPCGLAEGPDGSLYITDDVKGNIWKVSYKGD
jgi:glucose/arabinose dehydrogenase